MKFFPVSAALLLTATAHAGSYYIDANHGDNANDGRSAASAWKTFVNLPKTVLKGGDHILLKRGAAFEGSLVLKKAEGSESAPIVIDAYGEGNLPVIDAATAGTAVELTSCRYVQVKNLELTSDGAKSKTNRPDRYGVNLKADAKTACNHILLTDLYIHDIFDFDKEGGRGIHSTAVNPVRPSDLTIERCRIERTSVQAIYMKSADNVRILDNKLKDIGGPAINFETVKQMIIRGNEVDHSGSSIDPRMHGRGSGAWTIYCSDVLVEKNKFMHAWGINDSCGFHIDIGNNNVVVQYNLSLDNAGGFVEILGNNRNCAYRYNVSVNDGWRVKGKDRNLETNEVKEKNSQNFGYILWTSGFTVRKGRIGPWNSYIYNNTIYVKKEIPATFSFGSTTNGVLIANNIFQVMGKSQDVHGIQDNKREPEGAKIQKVVFKNNLYNRPDVIPGNSPIHDGAPIMGEARFMNAGGTEAADYIPTADVIVKEKGIPIEKLPGDEVGLKIGLKVKTDFFGNPVGDTPSLGAIEPGYAQEKPRSSN